MFCCFFPWSLHRFRDITYAKTLYLLSRQQVTAKTVISLQIQQIIDLSQRVTLKNLLGSLSTHVSETLNGHRKWIVLTFNLPSHNHIDIAKYLFSIRDE